MAIRVEKRMALMWPFFSFERFTLATPTELGAVAEDHAEEEDHEGGEHRGQVQVEAHALPAGEDGGHGAPGEAGHHGADDQRPGEGGHALDDGLVEGGAAGFEGPAQLQEHDQGHDGAGDAHEARPDGPVGVPKAEGGVRLFLGVHMDQQALVALLQDHARAFEFLARLLLGLTQQLVDVGPLGAHQLFVHLHVHHGPQAHLHQILGQDGAGDAAQDQRQGAHAQQHDEDDRNDPTGLADPVDFGLDVVVFHGCFLRSFS